MTWCGARVLLVLVALAPAATGLQDLSGKVFTFPQKTDTDHVRLNPSQTNIGTLTVCFRFITDLRRDHGLFSMATPSHDNAFLIFWKESSKDLVVYIRNGEVAFHQTDYRLNAWHSICSTWDSASGLVQLWFDGTPSIKKFVSAGLFNVIESGVIVLGQEQDSQGGNFYDGQSFLGMVSDVHMWNYILSPCEIQRYENNLNFTPGNVLNWGAMDFQITGRVLIEDKQMSCM